MELELKEEFWLFSKDFKTYPQDEKETQLLNGSHHVDTQYRHLLLSLVRVKDFRLVQQGVVALLEAVHQEEVAQEQHLREQVAQEQLELSGGLDYLVEPDKWEQSKPLGTLA
jgi:predicted acetyltransferase